MTGILTNASELHFRIWSEFHTMPGLRLTLGQACRLFAAVQQVARNVPELRLRQCRKGQGPRHLDRRKAEPGGEQPVQHALAQPAGRDAQLHQL